MMKAYILDDSFEISEEVKNMSQEERLWRIKIYEEAGRKEAENIPDTKPLLAN